jgi:hypothetical protein
MRSVCSMKIGQAIASSVSLTGVEGFIRAGSTSTTNAAGSKDELRGLA